jgi:hypothetical protein
MYRRNGNQPLSPEADHPFGPGEDGLDIEALANALLVVRRDPVGRRCFDVVDPERPLHRHLACHR